MTPTLQCDFCLAANPCWQYPAEDFRLAEGQMSHDGWAACSTCHGLIEAEKFDDLARRAAGRLKRHTGVYALDQIAANHAAFREHRSGPASPLDGAAYVSGLRAVEIEQLDTLGRMSAAAAPAARIEFHVDGPTPRPAQYCAQFAAHHGGLWKKVEETRALRSRRTDPVQWPDWCFLPRWWSSRIVAGLFGRRDPDVSDDSSGAWLSALAAWRTTQGVYRIDHDIAAELMKTPLTSDLPGEVLFRLPEWSVYVEAPAGLKADGCAVAGFFAYLDGISTEEVDLIVVADLRANPDGGIPEDYLLCHAPIALGAGSLEASIRASLELAVKTRADQQVAPETLLRDNLDSMIEEQRTALAPYISLLLYLCSTAADIADRSGRRERPANPVPVKTKKGVRMFPAEKVTHWDVGFRMGADLRRAAAESGESKGGAHASPRPHVRTAHWHHYWTGPRDSTQRKLVLKWLHPMLVKAEKPEDLVPTVRPVR
jgi:hypothetical protein